MTSKETKYKFKLGDYDYSFAKKSHYICLDGKDHKENCGIYHESKEWENLFKRLNIEGSYFDIITDLLKDNKITGDYEGVFPSFSTGNADEAWKVFIKFIEPNILAAGGVCEEPSDIKEEYKFAVNSKTYSIKIKPCWDHAAADTDRFFIKLFCNDTPVHDQSNWIELFNELGYNNYRSVVINAFINAGIDYQDTGTFPIFLGKEKYKAFTVVRDLIKDAILKKLLVVSTPDDTISTVDAFPEFEKSIVYDALGSIHTSASTIDTAQSLVDDVVELKERVTQLETKENKMTNPFEGLTIGQVKSSFVKMSLKGISVHGKCYNTKKNQLIDMMGIGFDGFPLYQFPCKKQNLKKGDVIYHNSQYLFVQEVKGNKVTTINPYNDCEVVKIETTNLFGFSFFVKVMCPFKMEGKGNNMMKMMMMSQMFNNGQASGDTNNMIQTMMMMSMLGDDTDMSDMFDLFEEEEK